MKSSCSKTKANWWEANSSEQLRLNEQQTNSSVFLLSVNSHPVRFTGCSAGLNNSSHSYLSCGAYITSVIFKEKPAAGETIRKRAMKEKVKIKFIFIATLGKEMVKIDYYTVS